jgi:maltodextrin utilization protein YvdJ
MNCNLPNNVPKDIAEIESKMKLVKSGGFNVYKADYQGGSIWTPAGNNRGKVYYFYNKALNCTSMMNKNEFETALNSYQQIINVKPDDKKVTKKDEFNFTPILLFAGAVLLLFLIFGFGGDDE